MTLETLILLAFLQTCAREYQVDPAFCLAVATIESGAKMGELKTGPLGKKGEYYAPFGIKKCFLKTGDPFEVIAKGVKALRPRKGEKTKKDILRRYNPKMTEAYYRAVCRMERAYRRSYAP